MRIKLPADVHSEISRLSAAGDTLARQKDFAGALCEYERAWALLPDPKDQWEAAVWLLAAIGDALFLNLRYEEACEVFGHALAEGAGAQGNPFLHLRRGESLFECGDRRAAADELMRAYMGAGVEIFRTEDPKYLRYLRTVADL